MTASRGRPRASSREILADAACELFLERGYEEASVTEIARRAGVSRSSFFNYFASKSDVVWHVFDERISALTSALADRGTPLPQALRAFAAGEQPDTLALAVVESRTMGVEAELGAGRAERQWCISEAIAGRLRRDGVDELRAEIVAAGYAAGLVGTVWRWANRGAGRYPLDKMLIDAIAAVEKLLS
ncbi:TetR/AcrR family transcriptional regulator [Leucobacter sp. USHLN153]|uniref:TetR/AcrR family transcriptional regulator n=1 Tax=Leucobacter sp. USHLN153 TaxID=3081268 RepID=UPI00301619EC